MVLRRNGSAPCIRLYLLTAAVATLSCGEQRFAPEGVAVAQAALEIDTCAELQGIEQDLAGTYVLTSDINCTGFDYGDGGGFKPIGFSDEEFTPFIGRFDGGGHVITGLTIWRPNSDSVGLFGATLEATIARVGLESADITGYSEVGGIIGTAFSETALSEVFVRGSVTGIHTVGGLVGTVHNGAEVHDSYSDADITAVGSHGLLFGWAVSRSVKRTYSSADAESAALAGQTDTGVLTGSFFDCEVAGNCSAPEAAGTAELHTQVLFTSFNWDFDEIWGFTAADTYPCLRWEAGCGCVSGRDSDGDGTVDCADGCSADPSKTAPGACGCGHFDVDSDGDEELDCEELCPDDPNKTEPGICGCGAPDIDTDEDELFDCNDPDSPTLIHNCVELQAMENNLFGAYRLANDVDCTDFDYGDGFGWKPVGHAGDDFAPFSGYFDGDGHTITGLGAFRYYDSEVGLFGLTNGATITRVGLIDVLMSGTSNVGGVVGQAIESTITDSYVRGAVQGQQEVGAIAGSLNFHSHARDVYADAEVFAETNGGLLIGYSDSQVARAYSSGTASDAVLVATVEGAGVATASFFDCEVAGNCSAPGAESTEDLQTQMLYGAAGWDFDTVWGFTGADEYPCLRWETGCGCISGRDSDGDSTPDCSDACSSDPSKTAPGICGCGAADVDTDGDTELDCEDGCPDDPAKTDPGVCGCGAPDIDTDSDDLLDCNDPDSPLDIHDCDELQAMSANLAGAYRLANDIDCTGYDYGDGEGWMPVGFGGEVFAPFTGHFNGNGHVIIGLRIARPFDDTIGLFGITNGATITRVGLIDFDIQGYRDVGALAGLSLETTISESYARGTILANENVGGLVGGLGFLSQARDSYAQVTITSWETVDGLLFGTLDADAERMYSSGESPSAELAGVIDTSGALTDSFFDCDVAGNCTGNGAESTVDMQSSTLYTTAGWDFTNVWGFTGSGGYPCLRWQPGCGTTCGSSDATCDGIDDDCDSSTDEDYVPRSTSCGVGDCASTGSTSCVSGAIQDSCTPGTPAGSDESCDGTDDDCDGFVDEDYASEPTNCGVGACARTGSTSCIAGNVEDSCTPGTPGANDTTCNGIDDDCSGTADEDYVSEETTCGFGACASTGSTSCVGGAVQDSCTPGTPTANDTTCNGIDEDCNGVVDEDYVSTGTTCTISGCNGAGFLICVNGSVEDTCTTSGTCVVETDCGDTVDNDNDSATDCADPDCAEAEGCRETDCDNSIDDNANGLTDCADPWCGLGPPCTPEICGNSLDDDGDGLIDCSDLDDCDGAAACPDVPPLAETVAPALDATVTTQPINALSFLYEGGDPIQRGVAPGTIKEDRVALITGKVMLSDGTPLPAIQVDVLGHPEFGMTNTDVDGRYQLAVNGGGLLTLTFSAPGYITVQRPVRTLWQVGGSADDVVMIMRSDTVSTLDVSGTTTSHQVAVSDTVTDADGTRRAVLMVPPGLSAQVFDENGAVVNVPALNLRMTEFTVGERGVEAMPGPLPPTSAYTYAIDITPDESEGHRIAGVDTLLSEPIPFYVSNFLDFPIGAPVPTGYYDEDAGQWKAIDSGLVIEIVSETSGMADIDLDGDGNAEDSTELAALAITTGERQQLASIYAPGDSLWRVRLPHLSRYDCNMGAGPPENATPPPPPPPPPPTRSEKPQCGSSGNSIVHCFNQTLAETIPIPGTPYSLHYNSDRTRGRSWDRSIRIPLRADGLTTTPPLAVKVKVKPPLGRVEEFSFVPEETPTEFTWTWSGTDAFGRPVTGRFPVRVTVAYEHQCEYTAPARFGNFGGARLDTMGSANPASRGDCRVALERNFEREVEVWDYRDQGLGAWSLSDHHQLDPTTDEVIYGDGTRSTARTVDATEVVVAPDGIIGGHALAEDGTIYWANNTKGVMRQLPGGQPEVWVPRNPASVCNTSNATTNLLCAPTRVAVGPNGDVYVSDTIGTQDNNPNIHRVLRIDPAGQTTRIAGSLLGFSGDGGPAIDARFSICDLRVADDGSIYIVDCVHDSVRRIGPDGIIDRVAGTGVQGAGFVESAPDARAVNLRFIGGSLWNGMDDNIALIPGGGFYLFERGINAIRHVSPSGELTTVYRTRTSGSDPTEALKRGIIDARGDLVIITQARQIFRLNTYTNPPIWDLIVGAPNTNANSCAATGAFPTRLRLGESPSMEAGPDGQLYIQDECAFGGGDRILRLKVNARGEYGTTLAASPDRSEVYEFDGQGRHIRTMNALTAETTRSFEYDEDGLLVAIEDGNGNRTEIERDEEGVATAIVAPFGQTTTLDYDENGYLAEVRPDPASPPYLFDYDANGLMLEQLDPRGHLHEYGHDEYGRVELDRDPEGGAFEFTSTWAPGRETVTRTSELGRVTTYDWRKNADGSTTYTITFPTGHSNVQTSHTDGSTTTTFVDGTIVQRVPKADPVFGTDAVTVDETTTTPGGLTRARTTARTVSLGIANDPLSLTSLSETMTENGRVTTRSYSAATQTWTTTSPALRTSTMTIDDQGRPVSTARPGTLPLEMTYDTEGRLSRSEQGSERFTDYSYDPTSGYLESQENALSEVTSYTTDAVGRVTATTRADSSVIGFEYDAESNLVGLTPPERAEHEMSYTDVDLLEDYTAPTVGMSSTVTHNGYSLDRELTSVTQPDGLTQTYTYHSTTGQLIGAAIPGAGSYTYGYDTRDRLASITTTGGFGSIAYTYDGSLVTSVTTTGPQSIVDGATPVWSGTLSGRVQTAYDNAFNVRSVDVRAIAPAGPHGFGVQYNRDADDLVTSIVPLAAASGVPAMTLSRSPLDGHVAATALGVVTTAADVDINTTTPGYGDLLGLSASISGVEVYGTSYQRDELGRIKQIDETIQGVSTTRKYEYDGVGRLIRVRDGSNAIVSEYEYDGNGARTRAETPLQNVELGVNLGCGTLLDEPVDAQDRLCRYGDYEYVYDENGRLASKTHVSSSAVTQYTYDGLGRLRTVELPSSSRIDYVLDALGRRIGKVVDGALVKGWLYGKDSLRPIAQLDEDGEIEATFVYETGVNVPDYIVMNSGAVLRVVRDHLESVRLVANVSSGVVAQRIDYDEFGNVTDDSAPGFQPFGFAGGLYDADTGLVRFGSRDYDAVTGRWTAKDPILFEGGTTNLYEYVGGDPVNKHDPSGLRPVDICDRDGGDCGRQDPPGANAFHCLDQCLESGRDKKIRDCVEYNSHIPGSVCFENPEACLPSCTQHYAPDFFESVYENCVRICTGTGGCEGDQCYACL